jgi:GGDEF domain-containing protein
MEGLRIEETAAMATHDSLTGLYLRGVFEFSLERIVQEHGRYDKALSISELVRQADKALYEAKRTGKDKVVRCA